jgi:hypothetical protein
MNKLAFFFPAKIIFAERNFSIPVKLLVLTTAVLSSFGAVLEAASTFSENFDSTTITSDLTAQSGWDFGSNSTITGTAQNSSGTRTYVTTTATDYNTVDFTAQVKVHLNGGSGNGIGFVGFGAGTPAGTYGEPGNSLYLRLGPSNFGPFVDATIQPSGVNATLADPSLGNGDYLVQVQKIGDSITLGVEQNYSSGAFVATPGMTYIASLSSDLSFLDSTNSTLFFGSQVGNTTFDDFSVTVAAAPEPSKAMLAVLGCGLALLRRRRAVQA